MTWSSSWMPPTPATRIDSPDQADPSQELTYVDIDTFLANF